MLFLFCLGCVYVLILVRGVVRDVSVLVSAFLCAFVQRERRERRENKRRGRERGQRDMKSEIRLTKLFFFFYQTLCMLLTKYRVRSMFFTEPFHGNFVHKLFGSSFLQPWYQVMTHIPHNEPVL